MSDANDEERSEREADQREASERSNGDCMPDRREGTEGGAATTGSRDRREP